MLDKLSEMLKGMDPKKLDEGIKRARAFVETPEGQELVSQLKSSDKEAILKNMDTGDASRLSQSERDAMVNELTQNPELLKKLKSFLQ